MADITPQRVNKIIERRGENTYVDKIDIQATSLDDGWGTPREDLDNETTTYTEKILWQKNILGEKQKGIGEENLGISTIFGKAACKIDNDPRYQYNLRRIYASGTYHVIDMKPHIIDATGLSIYKELDNIGLFR